MKTPKYLRKIKRLVKSKQLNFVGKCVYLPIVVFGKRGIAFLLIFTIISSSFFFNNNASAATYLFAQTSWAGGTDGGSTGIHPTNQSGWTQYSAKDSSLSAGATLSLSTTAYTATDDGTFSTTGSATGGDFDNGTNSQTAVLGSGVAGSVKLSGSSSLDTGSGADGAITISTAKNINTDTLASGRSCADGGDGVAYSVTTLTSNTATLSTTPSSGCLAANNKILLINLQADGTNLTNVGNYEILTIQNVATNTVTFTGNKTNYYGNGASDDTNIGTATTNQRVILQRVPQYSSVTVSASGSLTANAWDGAKGGVLAFLSTGGVVIDTGGSVLVSGKGYRGSGTTSVMTGNYTCYRRGESYNKLGIVIPPCFDGYPPNLGGGAGLSSTNGDWYPTEAAGGAYGTQGIYGLSSRGTTYGVSDLSQIFMGSAGGSDSLVNGVSGGGILIIYSDSITNSGSMVSNGANNSTYGIGGGAGGSILLRSNSISSTGTLTATGTPYISEEFCDEYDCWTSRQMDGGHGRIFLNSSSITGTTTPTATTASITTIYNTPGTFTSAPIDTAVSTSSWGNLSWTSSGTGTITVKARSGDQSDLSDATAWGSCTNITSGEALSTGGCVTNGHRYIQYQAALSTADTSVTPSLDSVTIGYNSYPSSATLTSSGYNSTSAANIIGGLAWIEDSSLPAGTTVTVSIRTASSSGGLTGASWSDFTNATSNCSKASNTVTCTSDAIPAGMKDMADDQWFQYKVALSSTGANAPTVSSVSVTYVVNDAPEFNNDYPSAAAGGVSAVQNADGTVTINYSIRDTDTTSGSTTPGYVTPSFEYSLNDGVDWTPISNLTLQASDYTNKAVDVSTYSEYSATWTATAQFTGQYDEDAKIRVTLDDNEAANNTALASSAAFTLDTKVPAEGAIPVRVDASQATPLVTVSATDDSSFQMRIGNVSDLSDADYEAYNATKVLSFSDGGTVYAQFKDEFENTSEIFSVTPPTTISNIYYQDISNFNTSDWREFIAWGVSDEPPLGFAQYNIYRSVDGGAFEPLTTVTNRLYNYIVDLGLNTNSTYRYKISLEDDDGNISFFSPATTLDTPDGIGGSDLAAPTLSSVSADNITTTTATVSWNTNKLSTSTVYYSDTNIYPGSDKTTYDESVGIPSMVLSHSVILSDLTPGTQYFFLTESEDASSNLGQSANALYTFTTEDGPVISNVTTAEVFDNEATISWNTNIAADSNVYYSTFSDFSDDIEVVSSVTLTTSHSVNITGLTQGTTYYYYIKSTDAEANDAYDKNIVSGLINYFSFNTSSDAVVPVISGVSAALVGETGATIIWTTDEVATSQIEWGLTPSLGTLTTETSTYTRQHTVILTGLTIETDYYYRVISKDRSNNSSSDDNDGDGYTFTTLSPTIAESSGGGSSNRGDLSTPVISDIKINSISSSSAVISFKTSKVANGKVRYGQTVDYESEESRLDLYTTSHVMSLQGLLPETLYHFQIISADVNGKTGTSSDVTFSTVAEGVAPVVLEGGDSLVDLLSSVSEGQLASALSSLSSQNTLQPIIFGTDLSVEAGSQSAVIEWATDKPANSLISYAKASDYNKGDKKYTTTIGFPDERSVIHEVVIENLSPSTTYHFQAVSKGLLGPVAISEDETFTTSSLTPDIINARLDEIYDDSAIISWETELPTKSLVEIKNTSTGEIKEIEDPSYLRDHVLNIEDLSDSTSYNLKIQAVDSDGNPSNSLALSFTTPVSTGAPQISNMKITTSIIPDRVETTQTIISWKTDKPSTSQIFFSEGVSSDFNQETPLDKSYVRDHIVITTALNAGTVYKIRAESKNVGGGLVRSEPYTVLTPKPRGSVIDIIFKNLETTFGFLDGD